MKTLRLTLTDLELGPLGDTHRVTGEAWARYTREVRTTDGRLVVLAQSRKTVPSTGVVEWQVLPNDDPTVHPDDKGFGIEVGYDLYLVKAAPVGRGALNPDRVHITGGKTITVTSADAGIVSYAVKAPAVPIDPLVSYPTEGDLEARLGVERATSDAAYASPAALASGLADKVSARNPAGAYQALTTTMWSRLDDAGAVLGGDGTAGGAFEVYTQISATGHDLALLVHGHADLHFSRAAASNRCQLLTITGAPTGGTFTLTYGGQTTTPLAYNCTAPQIVTALKALPSVVGDVYVYSGTGGPPVAGGPFTVTMAVKDPAPLTATSSLTGGTSPGVTISQTVPDGMAYFDIPIGGNIQVKGQFKGSRSTGHLEFKTGGTGGAHRFLANDGTTLLMSVNDAGLFTLGSLVISAPSDLPRIFGGGTSGGFAFYGSGGAAGTNGLVRFRDNATDNNTRFQVDTAAPPSGRTAIAVQYHNGTAVAFQYATVGAADSGGAGFRVLRVPN